jgi:uncharacterized protein (DUF2236 family)
MVTSAAIPPAPLSPAPFPVDTEDMTGDAGLFGPDSVTWRVHAHPCALVGGLRALLIQTCHPLAMAGVAQHSKYRQDPLGRFRRTAQFVNSTTYGTTPEAEAAIVLVRRIHAKINGVAPDGRAYRADDPALLSWVHNVEVDSILLAYRRFGPGISNDDADTYVREMARVGGAVGAGDMPDTAHALRMWVDHHPERQITRDARRAARFLVLPPIPKLMLVPYGIIASAAISLISVRERVALRLPSFPPAEPLVIVPATRTFLAALGLVLGPSPAHRDALERIGASDLVAGARN